MPDRQRKRHKRNREEEMTLTDIIRGLQYCVNSSQDIVEQHHINGFGRFFDNDGNMLTKKIKITDSAAVDIPLVCMSTHSSLILDELEVKLDLMLKKTALKQVPCRIADSGTEQVPDDYTPVSKPEKKDAVFKQNTEDNGAKYRNFNINRTCFGIDMINGRMNRDNAHLGISMKFKSCNPPEMISRIIDKLNNAVDIYSTENK